MMKLYWKDVKERDGKITLDVKSIKNKASQVVTVSDSAMEFAGVRREFNDRVFIGLTYSDVNNKLTIWVNLSGIERERTVTHDARRTCASLIWKKKERQSYIFLFFN